MAIIFKNSKTENKTIAEARRVFRNEKNRGNVINQPCEKCGSKAEAHHKNYTYPLKLTWLCRKHHQEEHRNIINRKLKNISNEYLGIRKESFNEVSTGKIKNGELISSGCACKMLGIDRRTLYNYVRRELIFPASSPSGWTIYLKKDVQWLAKRIKAERAKRN